MRGAFHKVWAAQAAGKSASRSNTYRVCPISPENATVSWPKNR